MTNLTTNTNKPFLVFGMPRTGTSLLMSIIKSYAIERFNISEYFSLAYEIIDDNITLTAQPKNKQDIRYPYPMEDKEINYRIEKLKKYKDKKISIKLLPEHINDTIFEYVKNEYQCILIERNRYEQLLSWFIAFHTDIWGRRNSIEINPHDVKSLRIVADLKYLNILTHMQNIYQEWKTKFLKENIVTCELHYEDFNEKNNFELIIKKLGLPFNNKITLNPPKKLYTLNEKETIITNLDEIKEYMEKINGK